MQLHSFDDFTPLREVIVGSAANYLSHDRDLSFDLFHHENLAVGGYRSDWAYPRVGTGGRQAGRAQSVRRRYTDELHEDVEGLAAVLAEAGVEVRRPLPLPAGAAPVAGLGWEAAPTPALNIRDNTLILGSEIIETPPAIRSRYLETRLLAGVFTAYWEAGATWTTMPRPVLADASFDLSYARDPATTLGGPCEPVTAPAPGPFDAGLEMMLDGAQVLRLGTDLVVNVATANHALAVRWLQRHLEGRHRVHVVNRMADSHIDSMLAVLRPGLLLARHAGIRDLLPAAFATWDLIVPPEPEPGQFPAYDDGDLVLTSPYIDLNVLSLDERTVLINQDCPGVMKALEGAGFTVIPVRHRHRRLFGGGFHCFTLDTRRDGGAEDYLG